ncbi:phage terminase large subunit family protein [Anaerobacillus sp. HL2]|nr:phage terminase large subunit family protein [Anaerobacillus sp. HL2]
MDKASWMVHKDCDRDYAEQVTAEHKVNVKGSGGKITQAWVPKTSHADNHYLDTEVYCMAAADVLHVRSIHLMLEEEEWNRLSNTAPANTKAMDFNDSWLKNKSWL